MIIPVFHVVTENFAIASTTAIEAGQLVALNSSTHRAVSCITGGSNNTDLPIGISADKNRPSVANEFQNRVSDSGQESAASGVLSVYMSGGTFLVDVNDGTLTTPDGTTVTGVIHSGASIVEGALLYPSVTAGLLHTTQTNSNPTVARIISVSQEITTGIPNELEPASLTLVDATDARNWIKIKLLI